MMINEGPRIGIPETKVDELNRYAKKRLGMGNIQDSVLNRAVAKFCLKSIQ
jgi:hypothetical protein